MIFQRKKSFVSISQRCHSIPIILTNKSIFRIKLTLYFFIIDVTNKLYHVSNASLNIHIAPSPVNLRKWRKNELITELSQCLSASIPSSYGQNGDVATFYTPVRRAQGLVAEY